MSQTKQILDYMRNGHSITALEALNMFGCFRLTSRISELRLEGHNIVSEFIAKDKKRYSKYYLKVPEKLI